LRLRTLLAAAVVCSAGARPALAQPAVITTLDSAGNVGLGSDVTYGPAGLAVVSYVDVTNGALKVALCQDIACTAAALRTLDASGSIGGSTSVAFGADGLPLVAYQDTAAHSVKVARCTDAACNAATRATLDVVTALGPGPAIGVGVDGRPIVLYGDPANGQVRVAHCADGGCGSAAVTPYAGGGRLGLTIGGDGLALFTAEAAPNVLVRHCSNAACSSATTTTITGGSLPLSASIATGTTGRGVVATTNGLFVARYDCADDACTFLFVNMNASTSGTHPAAARSVDVPNGGLQMVFFGVPGSGEHLKTISCTSTSYSNCFVRWIDAPGLGRHPAVDVGPQGHGLVSYEDEAAGDLKVAYLSGNIPLVLAESVGVVEGNSGTTAALMDVTVSPPTYGRLRFETTPFGTATADVDYVSTIGGLTFTPATPAVQAAVQVIGDVMPEIDEQFTVIFTFPSGVFPPTGEGITIVDDETGIRSGVTVGNASVVEGDSGTLDAVFQIHLAPPSSGTAQVQYQALGFTAGPGADFQPVSGTLTFAPGETTKTVAVPVLGDLEHEPDEVFRLRLSSPSGAYLADGLGVGSIVDDEVRVSVPDEAVLEADSGNAGLPLTVRLDRPSPEPVQVDFATADGSATAGADYVAASGTLTFVPGQTEQVVSVALIGDLEIENDETFQLVLSNASSGAILADPVGASVVLNDDVGDEPSLAVSDVTVVEGNTGVTQALFGVSLDSPAGGPVQVDFTTEGLTATSGVDFLATSGTLFFAPGQTARAVTVSVVGDLDVEPDETFRVLLSNVQGAILADPEGIGTIVNDDAPEAPPLAELRHGASYTGDLAAQGGPTADLDEFRIAQEPYASYEVVVDAVSGDLVPLSLELRAPSGPPVATGVPVGTGSALSLRWRAAGTTTVSDQIVRVGGACGTSCGPDDVYRVRAYETTLRAARFNNGGGQTTVLLLQNASDAPAALAVHFWGADGTLLATHAPAGPLPPQGVLVLDTSAVAPGASGSLTVAHDAPYGRLVGKAVAVEPATGFAFDTPLEPRPR
jgi:Calx-beta domain